MTTGTVVDLLTRLDQHFRVRPDRRSERWVPCQSCGKDEGARKATHCSYGERGYHCFVCGASGSLRQLAEQAGLTDYQWSPPRPVAPAKRKPKLVADWKRDATTYLARAIGHPDLVVFWRRYKPVSAETIERWQLGVAPLPPVWTDGRGVAHYPAGCGHRRLIYPVVENDVIVGLRGRAFECECPKILSAAGSEAVLFNRGGLRPGCALVIVENPVDAMLAMQVYPFLVAVASTAGVATWRPEWTTAIAAVRPIEVTVLFDNDLAGCPNSTIYREAIARWRSQHRAGAKPPAPRGVVVASELRAAGVPACLYRWPDGTPAKADLGDLLKRVVG